MSGRASAQDEQRSAVPSRETRSQQAAQQASEVAQQQAPFLEGTVTYEQVLADPDNVDLNLRYAKSQVARGDLLAASATLERILMVHPDLAQVRLFYGLVLFRLDSLQEAERELAAIRHEPMPADVRQQVEEALAQIAHRRRRTVFTSTTTIGWGYDRNRNAAPSSKNVLIADVMTPVEGPSRRRHDTSFLLIQRFDVVHDLGMQAGHQLLGSFTYFDGEQTRVNDLDLQAFSFEGGAALKTPRVLLTPLAVVEHVKLSNETYLRTQGGRVKLNRTLTSRLEVEGKTDWLREDFSGISENTAAFERKGSRVTVEGGANYALVPTMLVGGSIAYDRKDAKTVYYTYDGLTFAGSHTWILPKSQFIINALEFELDGYKGADTTISTRTRHDELFRYRITYGLPVSLLIPFELADPITNNLTATATFEQLRSLSTITNYTYSNSKYGLMVTKKIEF